MTRTDLRRLILVPMLMSIAVTGLAGCDDQEPSRLYACEPGGKQEWDSCYDFSFKRVHCAMEVLRERYAAGHFELKALPAWALTEERGGEPIIYDVRAIQSPVPPAEASGKLRSWAKRQGIIIEAQATADCAESTTEAEMREAEGGGRGTTPWESDEPVPTL